MKPRLTWNELIKIPLVKYGFNKIERLGLSPKYKILFGAFDLLNMVAFGAGIVWLTIYYSLSELKANTIIIFSLLIYVLGFRPLLNYIFLKIFK